MNVDRLSITLDAEVGTAVRASAARAGMSVSKWLAEAATNRLRNELLGQALAEWAAEDGPLTEAELDEAAATLGVPRRKNS